MKLLPIILLNFFGAFNGAAIAQIVALPVNEWAKKLADPGDKKNEAYFNLADKLAKLDSAAAYNFISELEKQPKAANNYFLARLYCLKAYVNMYKTSRVNGIPYDKKTVNEVTPLMAKAMHLAYELNDNYLAAMVSDRYGDYMYAFEKTELDVMYTMNACELYDQIHLWPAFIYYDYMRLSSMLWYVREYAGSIQYALKAINVLNAQTYDDNPYKDMNMISCYNTIALSYKNMHLFDSAFLYFQKGLDIERKIGHPVWKGIISGNIAQIYFEQEGYAKALPLFEMDYATSNKGGDYGSAANSLQWAARTNLKLGNKILALQQNREAFILLRKMPKANYLANIYFTAAEIYRELGNRDSLIYYSGLFNTLHDSLERTIYQSSISIAKLRLSDEQSRLNIMKLRREKGEQLQQRNFIIAGILFLAVIALLLINRQRLKVKYQQELAVQEKLRMQQENLRIQQEMESAIMQLKMFTENIIEKTNLVEKLEQQLNNKTISATEQQLISELSQQTILTEDDWDKFKSLFEKIFPLFFQRLKNVAADITVAEQRMAALTRLQLTTRQMASMLGISVDSVHKTKQRLRKRFNLGTDANMEEYIAGV